MSQNSEITTLEKIGLLADVLGVFNAFLNTQQISNQKLLEELQMQDNKYLDKILENQEKIIKLLEERK